MPAPQAPPAPEPDCPHFQRCEPPSAPAPSCGDPLPARLPAPGGELPGLRPQLDALPRQRPTERYEMEAWLTVQRALINHCAACADALAVISLPQHFQRNDVLQWQKRLIAETSSSLDEVALSYDAVYHPW